MTGHPPFAGDDDHVVAVMHEDQGNRSQLLRFATGGGEERHGGTAFEFGAHLAVGHAVDPGIGFRHHLDHGVSDADLAGVKRLWSRGHAVNVALSLGTLAGERGQRGAAARVSLRPTWPRRWARRFVARYQASGLQAHSAVGRVGVWKEMFACRPSKDLIEQLFETTLLLFDSGWPMVAQHERA